jgi:predicted RNase H-like HicB family nuclease
MCTMDAMKYVYWEDEGLYIGYLEEFPDYMTQGVSLEELAENLRDIFGDLTSGQIPAVRRVAELKLS